FFCFFSFKKRRTLYFLENRRFLKKAAAKTLIFGPRRGAKTAKPIKVLLLLFFQEKKDFIFS
ncbi:MAG: hypothetical protein Q4B50_07505, partial [Bacillota bacterium]|nr:hypothetical protein [Bacillota bacterium]